MSAPRRIHVSTGPPPGEVMDRVGRHLREGGLLAYPTETVYGFGGLVEPKPLKRLVRIKPPHARAGFLLLVASRESVPELTWTETACRLAGEFWPGPLTLILDDPRGRFPRPVRSDRGTVAIRRSPHPVAAAIVAAVGVPVTSTSANLPGEPPASSGEMALEAATRAGAGDELWVLDVGSLPPGPPSTIVDATGSVPIVVREGALDLSRVISDWPKAHESID